MHARMQLIAMAAEKVVVVNSQAELKELQEFKGILLLHFWASWSEPSKQVSDVIIDLADEYTNCKFVKVEAEALPEVSLQYGIDAVPTVVFIMGGKEVDRINGANIPEIARKVAAASEMSFLSPPEIPKQDLNIRLKQLISLAPCMIFMKGDPKQPKCGFSKQVVALLQEMDVDFTSFDILGDEDVRQGLKAFSNWPTYPQLYLNGELIGGLDILKELKESGELEQMLPKRQQLEDRLKSLINKSHVMLFMKGSPEQPRCGFSRNMCEILRNIKGLKFEHFDILQDEEVRQGLKSYSNWPSYPQLYVSGELIGGLDIVKELRETGELRDTLGQQTE